MKLKCIILLLLFVTIAASADKQLLKKGDIVNFKAGMKTTGRRTAPQPQIVTMPGSIYGIDEATCTCLQPNCKKWSCIANMPPMHSWGKIDVNCEGYDSKNDPYTLKDSCSLYYKIVKKGTFGERFLMFMAIMGILYLTPWWLKPVMIILMAILGSSGGRRRRGGRHRVRVRGVGTGSRR